MVTRQLITWLVGGMVLFTVVLGPPGGPTGASIVPVLLAAPAQQEGGAIAVGSRLWITGTGAAGLNLRSAPLLSGDVLGSLNDGDLVQVLEGPVAADGLNWYRVDSTSRADSGWVDGRFFSATAPGAQTPGTTVTPTSGSSGSPTATTTSLSPQQPFLLTATLAGVAEVPGPGADRGLGSAAVLVDQGRGMVCYTVHVINIDAPTAAHIHEGGVDVGGPVVVPFSPPRSGNANDCVSNVDSAVVSRLVGNPAGFYVNVHTSDFPDGAVRGQLGR